jgi:hypothetical protein
MNQEHDTNVAPGLSRIRPIGSLLGSVAVAAFVAVAAIGSLLASTPMARAADAALQVIGPIDAVDTLRVNAVQFTTDAATVIVNGRAADVASLGLGMTATVDGAWSLASQLPIASRVAVQRVVRAPVAYVGVGGTGWAGSPKTTAKVGVGGTGWAVAGLDLVLGASVQWVVASSLADIAAGATLDVYGNPDYTRSIVVASRIEVSAPEVERAVDVVGEVGAATTTGFALGKAFVDATTAAFEGLVTPIPNGTRVHVFGIQDATHPSLIHASLIAAVVTPAAADGTIVRVEGLIQDYMGPSQFTLQGSRVDATTAYVSGGRLSDLREGLHIEVTGVVRNGVVLATVVEIEDTGTALPEAEVEGKITALSLPSTLKIGSTLVAVDESTRIRGVSSLASLRVGWKAHAHGVRSGTVILARDLEIEH